VAWHASAALGHAGCHARRYGWPPGRRGIALPNAAPATKARTRWLECHAGRPGTRRRCSRALKAEAAAAVARG
jgi:hypothetical protein